MTIIIDGYNLLYAVGWARRGMSLPEWNSSRRRFLNWLADQQARKSATFHVILDGQNTKRKRFASETIAPTQTVQTAPATPATPAAPAALMVTITYGQTADEWIDQQLAKRPGNVVVSNDQLVRDGARRHQRESWTCTQFLDWLEQVENAPTPERSETEKTSLPAEQEADLLAAFSQTKPRRRR